MVFRRRVMHIRAALDSGTPLVLSGAPSARRIQLLAQLSKHFCRMLNRQKTQAKLKLYISLDKNREEGGRKKSTLGRATAFFGGDKERNFFYLRLIEAAFKTLIRIAQI